MSAATSLRTSWVPTPEEAETGVDLAAFKAKHALEMAERCASEMTVHEDMHTLWRERGTHWLAESDRWANVAILAAARRANKVAGRRCVHVVSQASQVGPRPASAAAERCRSRSSAAVVAANDTDRNGT